MEKELISLFFLASGATGLVVIAGILTTCIASVSYEIELHEKRASMDTGYYRPTCFEKLLLYIIQLSRLCKSCPLLIMSTLNNFEQLVQQFRKGVRVCN